MNDFEWQRFLFKLRSVNVEERIEAARELGERREPRSSPFLAIALYDDAPLVRRAAANALSKIGNELAIAAIIRAIAVNQFRVETELVEAIKRMADVKVVKKINQLLQNTVSFQAAAFALRVIARSLLEERETNSDAAAEILNAEKILRVKLLGVRDERTRRLVEGTLQAISQIKTEREKEKAELREKILQLQKTVSTQQRTGAVINLQDYRSKLQSRLQMPPKTTARR